MINLIDKLKDILSFIEYGLANVLICLIVILTMFTTNASAQGHGNCNIFVMAGGASTGIGVGFDSRFTSGGKLGYSVGISYVDFSFDTYKGFNGVSDGKYIDVYSRGVSVPMEINAIFGRRASKFEVGLGVTPYLIKKDEYITSYFLTYPNGADYPELNWESDRKSGFKPNFTGTLSIGYRLQRQNGFFMKLGVSFLFGDLRFSPFDGVLVLPGISLGYTIGRN